MTLLGRFLKVWSPVADREAYEAPVPEGKCTAKHPTNGNTCRYFEDDHPPRWHKDWLGNDFPSAEPIRPGAGGATLDELIALPSSEPCVLGSDICGLNRGHDGPHRAPLPDYTVPSVFLGGAPIFEGDAPWTWLQAEPHIDSDGKVWVKDWNRLDNGLRGWTEVDPLPTISEQVSEGLSDEGEAPQEALDPDGGSQPPRVALEDVLVVLHDILVELRKLTPQGPCEGYMVDPISLEDQFCRLPNGHDGWHESHQLKRWVTGKPQAPRIPTVNEKLHLDGNIEKLPQCEWVNTAGVQCVLSRGHFGFHGMPLP